MKPLHNIIILVLLTLQVSATTGERPNIVLIMVDDMGWSDIGCYGSEINTPNIDRLADEGLQFTQFYNNAKCTTTRASLLTGLYPRIGKGGLLKQNMLTLGEALRSAGYATGLSGKWHSGPKAGERPYDRGFDEAYGLWDGCSNFFNPKIPDPDYKRGRVRTFGHNDRYLKYEDFAEDWYATDAFTDHAIETIKDHVASGKPFFHYIPYTAPHYPIHAKPEDIAKYKGKYSGGWEVLRQQRLAKQKELDLIDPRWEVEDIDDRSQSWAKGKQIDEDWQQLRMEVYAAMIDSVDQNVGRVLATLDELGVAENTLVLFLSDNGGEASTPGGDRPDQIPGPKEYYASVGAGWASASNTPWRRYKLYCNEGGVATPLLARWPAAIKPSTRSNQVGHIIDFMPTFLEMAQAEYPDTHPEFNKPTIPLEGLSLMPIFKGEERTPHENIYWQWVGNRGVREGDWKLVWENKMKPQSWQLYDISKDRTEAHDLSASHPELTAKLAKKWESWADMTGVKYEK